MPEGYIITPFTLVNDDQLIDAQVAVKPLDDLRKDETFVGIITAVKTTRYGKQAYFKTPALVGGKWVSVSKILGYAHYEETPAAVEAAPQPAHMTDAGRAMGTLGYVNVAAGYGYIDTRAGEFVESLRFDTRNVFGGTQTLVALMGLKKGTQVSFAHGTGKNAVAVVIPGNEKSETHYASYMNLKTKRTAAPLPRARRNWDMNANTKTQKTAS